MPATYPLRPFTEWDLTNATVDQVRQAIDWSAGGVGTAPWLDMGAGENCDLVRHIGTATPTITGRSSAGRMATCDPMDPVQAAQSELIQRYDPSGGLYPDNAAFGWTRSGITQSFVGSALRAVSSGANYYNKAVTCALTNKLAYVRFRIARNAGHSGWMGVYWASAFGIVQAYLTPTGGIALNPGGASVTIGLAAGVGEYVDVLLAHRSDGTARTSSRLYAGLAGSATQRDTYHIRDYSEITPGVAGSQITWAYGNGAQDCLWGEVQYWAGDETATYASGSAPGGRRYWSFSLAANSGSTTGFDAASSLTAPDPAVSPIGSAIGSAALGAAWAAVAGASGYYSQAIDAGGDVVADRHHFQPGVVFGSWDGLDEAGAYRVRVWSQTDDGILSATSVLTEAVDLPPIPPAITLTAPTDPLEPGESLTMDVASTGGAGASFNGSALTLPATIVVGSAASSPPAPVALTVTPALIGPGEDAVLSWASTGAAITLEGVSVAGTGSAVVATGVTGPYSPPVAPAKLRPYRPPAVVIGPRVVA